MDSSIGDENGGAFKPYAIKLFYDKTEIRKTETINKKKLAYFIKNPSVLDEFKKETDIKGSVHKKTYNIEKILDKIYKSCKKTNTFDTVYVKATSSSGTGRFFVKGGIGLQLIAREIRQTIVEGIYDDYDFKNCHPEILVQLCEKNYIPCNILKDYVNNRDQKLNELKNTSKKTYEECKKQILVLINNGGIYIENIPWLKQLQGEIAYIHTKLIEYYPVYHNIGKKNTKNVAGSTFNHIACEIENQCLLAFESFLTGKGLSPDILCFDGLMVKINEKITNELLIEAEKHIEKMTDFKLTIVKKPFDKVLKMPTESTLTIDEADTYNFIKTDFEKTHFKITNPPSFIRIDEYKNIQYLTQKDMSLLYQNKYFKHIVVNKDDEMTVQKDKFLSFNMNSEGWYNDASMRTYEKCGYYPPPLECPENIYNTWTGIFIEETVPEILVEDYNTNEHIIKFLDFVGNLLGKDNTKNIEYLLNFYAYILQYPALKNNVLLILKGMYGSGKNTVIEILQNIVGESGTYTTSNMPRDILSRFSIAAENKVLNVFNELEGLDIHKQYGQIKDLITNPVANIERKGITAYVVPDRRKYLGTTNADNPLPIDENDRRNCMLETTMYYCKNDVFFDDFYKTIVNNETALRVIFQYLKQRDISNYNFEKMRPKSELVNSMIEANMKIEMKFLRWFSQSPDIHKKIKFELYTQSMYDDYFLKYIEINNNTKVDLDYPKFSNRLGNLIRVNNITGITKPDTRTNLSKYIIEPQILIQWFINKNLLSEEANIFKNQNICLIKKNDEDEIDLFNM